MHIFNNVRLDFYNYHMPYNNIWLNLKNVKHDTFIYDKIIHEEFFEMPYGGAYVIYNGCLFCF